MGQIIACGSHCKGKDDKDDEVSCYGCLRYYRNQIQHNELKRGNGDRVLREEVPEFCRIQ